MRFLALFFLPLFATAQQGWVSITIQGDGYGEETTWLVRDSSDAIVAGSAPLQGAYPYVEAFLPLPLGEYTFTIYDSFGDGICCGYGEGWFSINTCELDTTVYDFSTSEQTFPLKFWPAPHRSSDVCRWALPTTTLGPMPLHHATFRLFSAKRIQQHPCYSYA